MDALIVNDIAITREEFLGKTKYFMMSESREKYIKLSAEQYEFYNHILPWFKETSDAAVLEERLHNFTKGKIKLQYVLDILKKNNLSGSANEPVYGKVEMELSSRKVVELPLQAFQKKHERSLRFIGRMMAVMAGIIIVTTIAMFVAGLDRINAAFLEIENLSWQEIQSANYVVILIGSILAVPGHELGHLLMANHFKMSWKSFNCSLRWGVRFVYYIKYYNFYAFESRKKIAILSAGVFMNFVQACLWFLAFVYFKDVKYLVITTVNILCIINNILPRGTSDGYHIFCIMTGLEGIRWKMLKVVAAILKNHKEFRVYMREKENIVLIFYFMLSYFLSLFACCTLLKSAFGYLSVVGNATVIAICFSVFVAFVLISVTMNIVKFIKNLKKI